MSHKLAACANEVQIPCALIFYGYLQIEQIAVDPEAENGIGSISSLDAQNCNFSSDFMTQATQSQVQLFLLY